MSEGLYQNGANVLAILNGKPVITRKISGVPLFGCTLVQQGLQQAFLKLLEIQSDSSAYYLDEENMNLLGYQLLYESQFPHRNEQALEVFRLNVLLFLRSYNVYDSYGEALLETGELKGAEQMYLKALSLKPGNEESLEGLKRVNKRMKENVRD